MKISEIRNQAAEGRVDLVILNCGVALIDGRDPSLFARVRLAESLCDGQLPAREISRLVRRAFRCFQAGLDPRTGELF